MHNLINGKDYSFAVYNLINGKYFYSMQIIINWEYSIMFQKITLKCMYPLS